MFFFFGCGAATKCSVYRTPRVPLAVERKQRKRCLWKKRRSLGTVIFMRQSASEDPHQTIDRQTCKQRDGQTEEQTRRQADTQRDRPTDRQTEQTDRKTARQTDTQTNILTDK